ncbi:MAG: hypothetical protein BWY23_02742 [Spirochaetes bacterium ADurb.Bin218]|nr:MAG: hypothetical protein BWY23_02742 [Spirochaetes bacterium ADurb.Bin218]
MYKKTKEGIIIGRIGYGEDLLTALLQVAKKENITLAKVEAIGALQRATIFYYHQDIKKYESVRFHEPMEIISLLGNISIKDGEPMVHAHVSLGNSKGELFGGHLASESIVFACEFMIFPLSGVSLERRLDDKTGLFLWDIK